MSGTFQRNEEGEGGNRFKLRGKVFQNFSILLFFVFFLKKAIMRVLFKRSMGNTKSS